MSYGDEQERERDTGRGERLGEKEKVVGKE